MKTERYLELVKMAGIDQLYSRSVLYELTGHIAILVERILIDNGWVQRQDGMWISPITGKTHGLISAAETIGLFEQNE